MAAEKLPPVAERAAEGARSWSKATGRAGSTAAPAHADRARPDMRMMVVYGYARLVGYDTRFNLVPDILESLDVEDDRVFTFQLRKGHKWSDGQPFTSEDFRYYWEDVVNNTELSPSGPPRELLVDGEPPKVEILDETTVRYSWAKPNPRLPAALAGASPLFIYRPAHYLKKFHKKHDAEDRQGGGRRHGQRSWARTAQQAGQHVPQRQSRPADAAAVDEHHRAAGGPLRLGAQPLSSTASTRRAASCPTSTASIMQVADGKLIPAKAGAGEADLQARDLQFDNYTFLKKSEKQNDYRTPAVAHRQGLAARAVSQPQRERSGVAQADARRALPPRPVAGDRPRTRSTR